ncbi:hypothetical protein SAMN05421767_10415 [Granulicatella balaenopterae]|uniref:Uncharacterized protein n=1 Tax=Granulicatella balaenopterae TaxID=137733 RepID=A0A1H9I0R3_9LACT|nr:hypothetical protein [Granulicatella balaenopterae]SEQ68052.1 hypothetical protein SAMN05421767_10415 [Granulicatella balaenopterae]
MKNKLIIGIGLLIVGISSFIIYNTNNHTINVTPGTIKTNFVSEQSQSPEIEIDEEVEDFDNDTRNIDNEEFLKNFFYTFIIDTENYHELESVTNEEVFKKIEAEINLVDPDFQFKKEMDSFKIYQNINDEEEYLVSFVQGFYYNELGWKHTNKVYVVTIEDEKITHLTQPY